MNKNQKTKKGGSPNLIEIPGRQKTARSEGARFVAKVCNNPAIL